MWADGTPVVPCTETHRAETFHTGTVDAAPGTAQVQDGSPELFALYATCEAKAKEFLGADSYTGRIVLRVTLPRPDDWLAGVRAYSCEAFEIDQPGWETAVRRTSSLRGALAAPGPLTMGCFTMRSPPEWVPLVPAACDQPHDAEYVGAVTATQSQANDSDAAEAALFAACATALKAYVGSKSLRDYHYGYTGFVPEQGQLTALCFALPEDGKRFTASVKGIGDRAPPTV